MAAENYRWIDTNRRSEAEILSEIAACAAARVVLHRMSTSESADVVGCISDAALLGKVYLWYVPSVESMLFATNRWPDELSLLVTPPSEFNIIADYGTVEVRTSAARRVDTLWDWLILRRSEGEPVHRVGFERSPEFPCPLTDPLRHPLIGPKVCRISDIRRTWINRLADVDFPIGNPDVVALRAGLLQWHDALDDSHECAQSIEGQGRQRAGDYWHAIMHRREPDYGNSKYWFRRVGAHPIFPELARRAEPLISASLPEWKDRLLKNGWDPFAFVDLCETAAMENDPAVVTTAEAIQELEMLLLLGSTYHDATAN